MEGKTALFLDGPQARIVLSVPGLLPIIEYTGPVCRSCSPEGEPQLATQVFEYELVGVCGDIGLYGLGVEEQDVIHHLVDWILQEVILKARDRAASKN